MTGNMLLNEELNVFLVLWNLTTIEGTPDTDGIFLTRPQEVVH